MWEMVERVSPREDGVDEGEGRVSLTPLSLETVFVLLVRVGEAVRFPLQHDRLGRIRSIAFSEKLSPEGVLGS